jgi:L-ascorbate metabolism protein UlaG (beta-lactamase superfamily)
MKIASNVVSFLAFIAACNVCHAANIKITPVGQRTGEFCAQDRAILFEDPTGVRILYDPGNTVAGAADSRLGAVHLILVSHAHSDHLGNAKLNQDPNSSTASCSSAATLPAPSSNTAEIAAGKQSAVMAGGPLATQIGRLIAALTGSSTPSCPASGPTNEMTVPRASPCTAGLGLGAKRTVRNAAATEGVQVTAVTGGTSKRPFERVPRRSGRSELAANGLGAYVGLANGFVVTFTNGLKVYLSGDTGLTSDMGTIVHDYYGADLAVINIGDIFTTGPEEAAFAITELVRPASVIPSHVNEAATQGGVAIDGSKTARFAELVRKGRGNVAVQLPLSGVTMEFDSKGRCQAGCPRR